MAVFASTIETDGVRIAVQERRFLRQRQVPLAEWPALAEATGRIARSLARMVEAGEARREGETVVMSHPAVAALPGTLAEALGLGPVATLSATLSFEHKMTDPNGRIRLKWYDAAESVVRPSRRVGAFLEIGSHRHRLSHALFELVEAVEGYNAGTGASPEARIEGWAPVQALLRNNFAREARSDDAYLKSLTVYQAGAFALDVRETADGPDFVPVVMGREKRVADDDTDGPDDGAMTEAARQRDETTDALLPPRLQQRFAEDLFSADSRSRSGFVLDRNTYLVLDPEVKAALDVVRAKRRAPAAERRAFLRNPKPALEAALGDEAAGAGTSVFVETAQYSERVLGLGLWKPPAMPWLKTVAGQWMPERFPLQVGDRLLPMDEDRFGELTRGLREAEATASEKVEFDDMTLARPDVERALQPFLPAAAPLSGEESQAPPAPADTSSGTPETSGVREVLLISQNLEGLDYAVAWPKRLIRTDKAFPHPTLAATAPKPHQEDGFAWLVEAWQAGWPGVLLADDMGLGKTFQALAFLAWLRRERERAGLVGAKHQPILVVAPTALLRNWADEAGRHLAGEALGRRVDAYGSGLARLRRARAADTPPEEALDLRQLREADWILTTYETLANHHRAFARLSYSVAVFDEAQKIKAPGSINTQSAKAMNADFVLALTGTPIENRLTDLWCIMDRVVPGYLGDLKTFAKRYDEGSEAERDDLRAKLDRSDARTPAVLLRRMKAEILSGLPMKRVETRRVVMPPTQAAAYAQAVASARLGARGQNAMLQAIHSFRGVSLHPNGASEIDPYDGASVETWISRSARVRHAIDCLEAIRAKGEKALIFLEDRAVQRVLAAAIATHFGLEREPAVINGSTPGDRRLEIVDAFQAAPPGFGCLVLSPKAAGVGLTITAANHVVHLSRWWNPAVEDQCNDRVYRIGQTKDVTIHVPVAVHPDFGDTSFDVTLDALLERKRALSRDMLVPPVADGDVSTLFEASLRRDA